MVTTPHPNRFRFSARLLLGAIGILLLAIASLLSSESLEMFLRGSASDALRWGPDLFRCLLGLHGVLLVVLAIPLIASCPPTAPADCGLFPGSLVDTNEGRVSTSLGWLGIGILCIIALALRLWKLNSTLWFDEILTLVDFVHRPLGEIVSSFPWQNQHMLYSVLARVSVLMFGDTAWALRLPAVFFGVASIIPLYGLGRRLIGSRAAFIACVLMVLSYHHVWFSQNARGYSGLLLFATASTWFWIEALDNNRWHWWGAYILAVVFGMYTHVTMFFVVLAHTLVYLTLLLIGSKATDATTPTSLRTMRGRHLVALVLSVTITLLLYALALPDFLQSALHEKSRPSEWTNPMWLVVETVRGLQAGLVGGAALLVGALLLAVGFIGLARRHWPAAVAMILPGPILCFAMFALGHNLWPRFLFFSMAFAFVFVVHGTELIARIVATPLATVMSATRLSLVITSIVWAMMVAVSLLALPRCYAYPKQDFEGARDYVHERIQTHEIAVAVGQAGIAYHRYYAPTWPLIETTQQLEHVRDHSSAVWLVYTVHTHMREYHRDLWNQIVSDFEVVRTFQGTLNNGKVFVCRERRDS